MKENFKDFISLDQFGVPEKYRNQFFDSVLKSMEDQKNDVAPEDIIGLKTTNIVTHATKLTSHNHLYTPSGVRAGVDTFLKPFPKPILAHHDDKADAIGRVSAANYVSTIPSIINSSLANRLDNYSIWKSRELKDLKKIYQHIYSRQFEGFGYVLTEANITDEDAIKKVIDKRYLTISIGYDTDMLFCSVCGQEWYTEGPCEHKKGIDYNDHPMFLIFGNMTYEEHSYVNKPADSMAMTISSSRDFMDKYLQISDSSISKLTPTERAQLLHSAIVNSDGLVNPLYIVQSPQKLYFYDSAEQKIIPQQLDNNNKTGETMAKRIHDLSPEEVNKAISEKLDENQILSEDDFNALEDKDFVGSGRLFPAVNEAYIQASLAYLEEFEADEADKSKKELLERMLTERLESINVQNGITDSDSDESADAGDTQGTDEGKDGQDNVEDTEESTTTEETTDYLEYTFRLEAGGWGLPNEDDPNYEAQKQILDLLLSLHAKKGSDAVEVINSILNNIEDGKDSVIEAIAKDKISELQNTIDTYKNEFESLQTNKKNLDSTVANLTKELKDFYIEDLIKENIKDPGNDVDSIKSELESQSLIELRASRKNISIFNKKGIISTDSKQQKAFSFNENQDNKITLEEIKKLETEIDRNYRNMLQDSTSSMADNYLRVATEKLNALKDKWAEENADSDSEEN